MDAERTAFDFEVNVADEVFVDLESQLCWQSQQPGCSLAGHLVSNNGVVTIELHYPGACSLRTKQQEGVTHVK